MGGSVPVIPGRKHDPETAESFRYEVSRLLDRRQRGFPGAQPVSFAARHLQELQKQDYYVCEKSDGMRCLMYLTCDGPQEVVYLIDRKNDYYHVPGLHFPLPGEDMTTFHTRTLVDGELVNDRDGKGGTEMKYLVFDCLVLDGKSLMHRTLDKRLAYFREMVIYPHTKLLERYPEEIHYLPFRVEFKQMEFSYALDLMFNEILPKLPHGNDGLIFTCRNSPYQSGTDPHILKWKSEDENSVDFRMNLHFPLVDPDTDDEDREQYPDYRAMPQFNLSASAGSGKPGIQYGTLTMERDEWEAMKSLNEPLNDRVVECYMDKMKRWRFLRFRDDKPDANYISTVDSVMESIQDGVSKEDLIRTSKKIREEWKKRAAAETEEANAKGVNEARKTAAIQRPIDGQPKETRVDSATAKRKFGSGDDSSNNEHS